MNLKRSKKLLLALCLSVHFCSTAQSVITGTVTNLQGEPVPFVLLSIEKTQLTTTSDERGTFQFKPLKNGQYIIHVNSPGHANRTDTLQLEGNVTYAPAIAATSSELDEVVVDATRAGSKSGMAYNTITAEELKKQNLGQDAPYIMNQLPNVVVNSDAGNGVGYTGLRIRGSDATRINVTINGVPVNDAESQGTFWVNMPDLVSSVNNVQVQRGVGASSNGAGAFGATINFQTNTLNQKPYSQLIATAGSFDTRRYTLSAGTGLVDNKFSLDARVSKISSAGYIDRASSDLSSYYISAGYYGKKSVLKFINFAGWEKTYQAWYYVPQDSLRNNNRTYNPAGEYYNASGKPEYYSNETDNYNQNNSQLHYIRQIGTSLHLNVTAHYTKGKGYYEQFKQDENFSDYMMAPATETSGDTIFSTDLVRRLWLDNDFAGGVFNLTYKKNSRLNFVLGGGYNTYFGKHFGRVIWSRAGSAPDMNHQYYLNTGNKNDRNIYVKTNYRFTSDINFFVDLQSRGVSYRFMGFDDSLQSRMQDVSYEFFNPKAGVSIDLSSAVNVYASVALANKEPNRDDFVQSSPGSRPRPEQLTDVEAGLKFLRKKLFLGANFYHMQYRDQLVLNGQVNNVGAYNRINVPSSFRQGVEMEAEVSPVKFMRAGANLSLSNNKITSFTEYIDSSDVNYTIYTQHRKQYSNVDISFSPSVVGSGVITFIPVKDLEVSLIGKYVGRQFLDNTGNISRSINPYQVVDARINYLIRTKVIPEISFMLGLYNLLNTSYETNGYTFSYYEGDKLQTFNYLAPAAPFNFLGGVSLKF